MLTFPVSQGSSRPATVGFRLQAASAICLASLLPACNLFGCKYVDVHGQATVTKIFHAEADQKGKVVVTLDFQAGDHHKQKSPHHPMPNTFSEEISKQEFDEKHPALG